MRPYFPAENSRILLPRLVIKLMRVWTFSGNAGRAEPEKSVLKPERCVEKLCQRHVTDAFLHLMHMLNFGIITLKLFISTIMSTIIFRQ